MLDIVLFMLLAYRLCRYLLTDALFLKTLVGFTLLVLVYSLALYVNLPILRIALEQLSVQGMLVGVIVFQKEIKRLLLRLGEAVIIHFNILLKQFSGAKKLQKPEVDIAPIVEAAKTLAGGNTGALIIVSKKDALRSYQESGEPIGATISKRLLLAIFNKQSPLHDGAVIIYGNKIAAARCILPVTERRDVPAHLGLRHRAAIGMAEVADVLVISVSEETGQISTARDGQIDSNLSVQEIRAAIYDYLQSKKHT